MAETSLMRTEEMRRGEAEEKRGGGNAQEGREKQGRERGKDRRRGREREGERELERGVGETSCSCPDVTRPSRLSCNTRGNLKLPLKIPSLSCSLSLSLALSCSLSRSVTVLSSRFCLLFPTHTQTAYFRNFLASRDYFVTFCIFQVIQAPLGVLF